MTETVGARIIIEGDAKQVVAEFEKLKRSLGGAESGMRGAKGAGDKLASSLKSLAVGLIGPLSVVAGLRLLTNTFKKAIDSAAEAQRVMAQTEAVIRSTGGVAGLTAGEIGAMAKQFQATTTYSDEAVQSMQNVLLTFTALGKDIMPQATQVVLDMATALGSDLQGTAIQVGKALQDPILGITALRRVGVNFNQEQTEVIRNLVRTGRAAEAQALIMKELNTEFGGSAAAQVDTYSGRIAQLNNQLDELYETLGTPLLGPGSSFVQFLTRAAVAYRETNGETIPFLVHLRDSREELEKQQILSAYSQRLRGLAEHYREVGRASEEAAGVIAERSPWGEERKSVESVAKEIDKLSVSTALHQAYLAELAGDMAAKNYWLGIAASIRAADDAGNAFVDEWVRWAEWLKTHPITAEMRLEMATPQGGGFPTGGTRSQQRAATRAGVRTTGSGGAQQAHGGPLQNPALVGEEGPELIIDGVVIPASTTRELMRLGLAPKKSFRLGGTIEQQYIPPSGYDFDTSGASVRAESRAIRSGGGSVVSGVSGGSTAVAVAQSVEQATQQQTAVILAAIPSAAALQQAVVEPTRVQALAVVESNRQVANKLDVMIGLLQRAATDSGVGRAVRDELAGLR